MKTLKNTAENKTVSEYIGDAKFDFTIEYIDRVGLDTKVSIAGNTICFISLPQKNEFVEKLKKLIADYRI